MYSKTEYQAMPKTLPSSSLPKSPHKSGPPASRQKAFIVENVDILDRETRKSILSLVMMEIGRSTAITQKDGTQKKLPVVLEGSLHSVSINLDNIHNSEVISHIYNIVNNRRISLCQPYRKTTKKT